MSGAGEKDFLDLRLTAIRYGARGVNFYELRSPSGELLPEFTAGAHVDLHVPGGFVRQYSLMNDPAERDRYELGIKLDDKGRGGSRAVHRDLRVGDLLRVGPPRNNFPLTEGGQPVVLIGGGIGMTPMLAMAHRARAAGLDWRMSLVVRDRADMLPLAQLGLSDEARIHVHVDAEEDGRLFDLGAVFAGAARDAHLYCCGPAPMLDAFAAAAAAAGWPEAQIHVEHFSAAPASASARSFELELARSGKLFRIEEGQRILDVLREAGVSVQASCEQGICGACETRIISGVADHQDKILTAEEKADGQTMMICCSGSLSERLVIDL